MDIYTDAVLTPCAHTFCRDCIGKLRQWMFLGNLPMEIV